MTTFDDVARAIWEADPVNPPYDSLIEGRFSWNLAQDQARAALKAIREPSPMILKTMRDEVPVDGYEWEWIEAEAPAAWYALIDHILGGGT